MAEPRARAGNTYEMLAQMSLPNLGHPLVQDKGAPRVGAQDHAFSRQLRRKVLDGAQNLAESFDDSGLETKGSIEEFKGRCERLLANVRQYHAMAASDEADSPSEQFERQTRGGLRDGSAAIQRWLLNPCERCLSLVSQLTEGSSGVHQQVDFWLQELRAGCGILEVQSNPLATPDADDEAEDPADALLNTQTQEALLSLRYNSKDICIKGTFITVVDDNEEAGAGKRRARSHPPRLCLSRGADTPPGSPQRQRALSMLASIVDMGVPPPPPPLPVAEHPQRRLPTRLPTRHDASATSGPRLSVGTRGHPHACGTPCRYVRKKTGCRDGADCPNCHECLWQRKTGNTTDPWQTPLAATALAGASPLNRRPEPLQPGAVKLCTPEAASSTENLHETACCGGSQGHPHTCGPPCRYVRRQSGCRDGANCPNCHVCLWQRGTRRKRDATAPFLLSTTASGSGNESDSDSAWQSPQSPTSPTRGARQSAGAAQTPKEPQRQSSQKGLPLVLIDRVQQRGVPYFNDY